MHRGTYGLPSASLRPMHTANPLLRVLAALAIVIGISAIPIAQVAACSCMPMSPAEAAAMADAAFTGTVVGEQPMAARDLLGPEPMGQTLYAFEVDGIAKGDVGAQTTVLAGGDSAGCGMSFAMEERWLIFAYAEGDQLTTGLCSANVPLAADEDPPVAVTPVTATPAESGGGVPFGLILPAVAVLALVGIAAFLFWRADRPSVTAGPRG